jgi:hypothetical protein
MFGRKPGSAEEELLRLVRELTFSTRKSFGMYGQIHTGVVAVSREELTLTASTRHPRETDELTLNVRNAFVNHLGGLLSIERIRVIYSNPTLGIEGKQRVFPMPRPGERLRSHVILVEPIAGPHRASFRKRFEKAWRRLQKGS